MKQDPERSTAAGDFIVAVTAAEFGALSSLEKGDLCEATRFGDAAWATRLRDKARARLAGPAPETGRM